jgi:hypothetical protein
MMKEKFIQRISLVIIVLLVLVSSCKQKETSITPDDSPVLPARGFFMGILPNPMQGQGFDSVYKQVAQYAEFAPVWGRPTTFYNLAADLSGSWGKTFVTNLIRGNDMFPIIHLSFIGAGMMLVSPPGIVNPTMSNPEWRAAYKNAAIDVVHAIRPLYLSLGNEVNYWFETYDTLSSNPNGFQYYVSLYEEIYDTLKIISPQTKIFCTFAREIVSEYREANLSVLNMFDANKLDLLVFTSYPHSVQTINRPTDIPNDYYSRIDSIMPGKQFGFSEIACPSMPAFGGDSAQAEFLTLASGQLTRSQGMNLHLFGWAWLHDIDSNDYTGLIKTDGIEKLAYSVWKNLSTSGKSGLDGSHP